MGVRQSPCYSTETLNKALVVTLQQAYPCYTFPFVSKSSIAANNQSCTHGCAMKGSDTRFTCRFEIQQNATLISVFWQTILFSISIYICLLFRGQILGSRSRSMSSKDVMRSCRFTTVGLQALPDLPDYLALIQVRTFFVSSSELNALSNYNLMLKMGFAIKFHR